MGYRSESRGHRRRMPGFRDQAGFAPAGIAQVLAQTQEKKCTEQGGIRVREGSELCGTGILACAQVSILKEASTGRSAGATMAHRLFFCTDSPPQRTPRRMSTVS